MAARFKKGQVTGQGLNSCSSPQLQMFNVTEVTGTFWLPFTIKVHQVALFGPLDFNPFVFFLIVGDHCQSCWWRWEFKLIRTQSVSVCACVCVCLGGGSLTHRGLYFFCSSLFCHMPTGASLNPHTCAEPDLYLLLYPVWLGTPCPAHMIAPFPGPLLPAFTPFPWRLSLEWAKPPLSGRLVKNCFLKSDGENQTSYLLRFFLNVL